MMRRVAAVLAVAAVLLSHTAGPAAAEVRGRIVGIEPGNGELRVSFSVAGLSAGQQIDLASVQLQLGDRALEVTAQPVSAAPASRVVRRVMLTIDTSGSMAGAGIEGARQAASAYLDKVPPDVQVGLVTFSDDARLVFPPSRNRVPVRAAVTALQARGDTALYDAVALAASSFPKDGDNQILLLSDGADDGSTATLAGLTSLLARGDVPLNAVAFRNTAVEGTLEQLTKAAGGRVISADQAAALSAAFAQVATATGNDIVLAASIPEDFDAPEATVVVSATAAGQRLTDSALAVGLRRAVTPTAAPVSGPRPAELAPPFLRTSTTLYLAMLALFVGAFFLITTLASSARGRSRVSNRLEIYTLSGRGGRASAAAEVASGSAFAESLRNAADRLVKGSDFETRLARRLEAGGIPLKPAEWLMMHVGLVLCAPLLVLVLTSANIVLTLLAAVLSLVGPWLYLMVKKRMRTRSFLAQLPDVLQLMSGSLSAGYSLPQAVDAVVRQGNDPVATEFNKALVEARIGAPIEDALDDIATRMESVDFSWVVMAIRIQRDVGGNLAEILATVAATLRERERLRRQVQVLSAEGRLSAYILGGLPVVFALYLLATKPSYLQPLIEDPIGYILLGSMAILMVVGSLWMKKVVTVEV